MDKSAEYELSLDLAQLPLFHPDHEEGDAAVRDWRSQISAAESVIIATPEYIHGMPAVLKNALEWLTKTGELSNKRTIAICYTPQEPRGKKALISLLNSLMALDAQVVSSLQLYHTDIAFNADGHTESAELPSLLQGCLELL